MHKLFKPLSKRDAKIAAVLFGIGFVYMLFFTLKEVFSGKSFDELHSDLLLLIFIGIIEWGMVTVAFYKDKNKEAAEDEEDEESQVFLEGENDREGSEEFTEGLSEEFEGYGSDSDGEYGGSEGGFGGESGEAGGGGGDAA